MQYRIQQETIQRILSYMMSGKIKGTLQQY